MLKISRNESGGGDLFKLALRWANVAYLLSQRLNGHTDDEGASLAELARRISGMLGYGEDSLGLTLLERSRDLCEACESILERPEALDGLSESDRVMAGVCLAELREAIARKRRSMLSID